MKPVEGGKYKCAKCGYVYDPERGEPKHGIEPETKFKDLPDNWSCPRCRKGKDLFRPV